MYLILPEKGSSGGLFLGRDCLLAFCTSFCAELCPSSSRGSGDVGLRASRGRVITPSLPPVFSATLLCVIRGGGRVPLPIRVGGHTRRLVPWRGRTPAPHVQTPRDRPSLELPADPFGGCPGTSWEPSMGGSIPGQALEEPASGQKERPKWKPTCPARVCISPGSQKQLQAECLLDVVPLFA